MGSAPRLVGPEPPADLNDLSLPPAVTASTWIRLVPGRFSTPIHWCGEGRYRFDSPSARWGVCYAAESISAAFQEVWGDEIRSARRINWQALESMVVWQISVSPRLRTLELTGDTLPVIKAILQSFVSGYAKSQRWGTALMNHPANLDGLQYFGRRSGRSCLALFGDDKSPKAHQSKLRTKRLGRMTNWASLWTYLEGIQVRVGHLPSHPPDAQWS